MKFEPSTAITVRPGTIPDAGATMMAGAGDGLSIGLGVGCGAARTCSVVEAGHVPSQQTRIV